jgi:hypothetical protein
MLSLSLSVSVSLLPLREQQQLCTRRSRPWPQPP